MKNTGIVRRVDELGRIVLPKEMRKTMGIKEGDPMEIYVEGDSIILKKYQNECKCKVCGQTLGNGNRLVTLNGVTLCTTCIMQFTDEM